MAVEILTVSLSDESIARIADAVAAQLLPANRAVTHSNHPSAQTPQGAEPSGFQPQPDPWVNSAPPQTAPQATQAHIQTGTQLYQQGQQQAPQQPQGAAQVPMCAHGPKKWVEPGFSKNTGKAYQGFYACPAPRGQQCPR